MRLPGSDGDVMIRTRRAERKTNEAVMDKVDARRTTTNAIVKRKIKLIVRLPRCNRYIVLSSWEINEPEETA